VQRAMGYDMNGGNMVDILEMFFNKKNAGLK
jgi:hypothetical protein